MLRQTVCVSVALVAAFVLGGILMGRPPAAVAQNPAGQPQIKCVGISAAPNARLAGSYRVYRAFEDGRVEAADDVAGGAIRWQAVGQ